MQKINIVSASIIKAIADNELAQMPPETTTKPRSIQIENRKKGLGIAYVDRKTLRGLRAGTKLPHIGAQQRMMAQLKAAGQWFWTVQKRGEGIFYDVIKDTEEVIVTSEKYKHEFTRRMSKPEVFEYVRKVAIEQNSKQVSQTLVSQSSEKESKENGS